MIIDEGLFFCSPILFSFLSYLLGRRGSHVKMIKLYISCMDGDNMNLHNKLVTSCFLILLLITDNGSHYGNY
jgi:hypothetical protein